MLFLINMNINLLLYFRIKALIILSYLEVIGLKSLKTTKNVSILFYR